jgi:hypothetical protein
MEAVLLKNTAVQKIKVLREIGDWKNCTAVINSIQFYLTFHGSTVKIGRVNVKNMSK